MKNIEPIGCIRDLSPSKIINKVNLIISRVKNGENELISFDERNFMRDTIAGETNSKIREKYLQNLMELLPIQRDKLDASNERKIIDVVNEVALKKHELSADIVEILESLFERKVYLRSDIVPLFKNIGANQELPNSLKLKFTNNLIDIHKDINYDKDYYQILSSSKNNLTGEMILALEQSLENIRAAEIGSSGKTSKLAPFTRERRLNIFNLLKDKGKISAATELNIKKLAKRDYSETEKIELEKLALALETRPCDDPDGKLKLEKSKQDLENSLTISFIRLNI